MSNPWERAQDALKDGIATIRQLRDNGPGLVCYHADALEAMIAVLAEMERVECVEGRHTDDGEFYATEMRCLGPGPALLLLLKEVET